MATKRLMAALGVGLGVVLLAGCQDYVKQDDFNSAITKLQNEQSSLQSQVDANKSAIADLKSELETKLQKYDAEISQLKGRVNVDKLAHFAYDKSQLRDQDKAGLKEFAAIMTKYHPNAMVTVEGFADAAGKPGYNKRLGMKRAEAVRNFLVASGMNADQLRTVSYGKARDRQVVPGAWGDKGWQNRRVTLVIDATGGSDTSAS